MSQPQPSLVNGEIYHIYNRGVEKRTLFTNTHDYWRFIHDLFIFNDTNPPLHSRTRLHNNKDQNTDVPLRYISFPKQPRTLLVDILVFCLMPNHFHLMVRQRVDNGITTFMRKLGTGYTNYFNTKYTRVGPLFQGIFKAAPLEHDAHFLHLPHYIHANPLALLRTREKEGKERMEQKMKFLKEYRWSSYLDYMGVKNIPSITHREPLLKLLNNPSPEKLQKEFMQWLRDFSHKKSTHTLPTELHTTAFDMKDET